MKGDVIHKRISYEELATCTRPNGRPALHSLSPCTCHLKPGGFKSSGERCVESDHARYCRRRTSLQCTLHNVQCTYILIIVNGPYHYRCCAPRKIGWNISSNTNLNSATFPQVCDGNFDCFDLSDECLCDIHRSELVEEVCNGLCAKPIWRNQPSNPNCDFCNQGEVYWKSPLFLTDGRNRNVIANEVSCDCL